MKKRSYSFFIIAIFLLCLFAHGFQVPTDRLGTEEIEQELYDLINRERAKQGISLLHISKSLIPLARSHSQDMAAQSDLTHISHDGKTYALRLQEAGLYFKWTG